MLITSSIILTDTVLLVILDFTSRRQPKHHFT